MESYVPVIITAVLYYLNTTYILPWVERRKYKTILEDPLYRFIKERDLELPTQILTYLIVAQFLYFLTSTDYVQEISWSFSLFISLRTICMYVTPLQVYPCKGKAWDPFQEIMTGTGTYRNDLMFSGHVGHTFLMTLWMNPHGYMFWYLHGSIVLIGMFMIISRVHYTIDIIVAYLASVFCFVLFHPAFESISLS